MSKPWFRLYGEFITDPKVQLLDFGDQRHFIGVLCLKSNGTIDSQVPTDEYRERMIAKALGLDVSAAKEAKRRLQEVGLIDELWQPIKWTKRQTSHAKDLPDGEDLEGYKAYVYFIGGETGNVKIGYSKNPWARLKDIQSTWPEKLRVVATVRTTENSEINVHKMFHDLRVNGEWFTRSALIDDVLSAISNGSIKSEMDLDSFVKLRSNDVATTKNRVDKSREESSERTASRKAFRLPTDFQLTAERKLVAEAEKLPAERTFEKFRDYWSSASGAKARKLDWDATWRNWCRTEADRGGAKLEERRWT